jgi:hypothetical protein
MIRVLFFALLAAALSGCVRTPHVLPSTEPAIIAASYELMKQSAIGPVPPSKWPDAVKALDPQLVTVRPDGIYITTSKQFVREAGLFIPRPPAGFRPAPEREPKFRVIVPGLLEYQITG